MRENFGRAVAFALEKEGYKTDDPRDPGKLTIWGISVVYHPVEVAKMAMMSKEEAYRYASDLYLEKYWHPNKCNTRPFPEDWVVFDIAINPGAKLVKNLRGDWNNHLWQRVEYYCNLVGRNPVKRMYLRGWINRTLELRKRIGGG